MVDMVPITSTALAAVGYDSDENVLFIQFRKRGTYMYEKVPPDIYEHLISEQESAGQFFNFEIKPYYKSHPAVPGANTAAQIAKQVAKTVVKAAITKGIK